MRNREILAFLRAKNKLDDFVGTLAKYLPISWQHKNLQFVSRWMNVRALRWPRNIIIEVLIYFAFKIFVPQITTWKPALSMGQRNTFFLHLNILRRRHRNKWGAFYISPLPIFTFYSTTHYVNALVKLPKYQLFSLSLYFNYCAPQLPDASVLFLQRPIYKRERCTSLVLKQD